MKCRNCGSESPVGAKYCASCGAVLEDCTHVENQAQTANNSGGRIHDMYANALIKSVKSPVFLIALVFTILGSVVALLFLGGYSWSFSLLADEIFFSGQGFEVVPVFYGLSDIFRNFAIILFICALVYIVGLIIVRSGASKGDRSLMRSGLTTIKILKIVQCVLSCIALVAFILVLIVVLLFSVVVEPTSMELTGAEGGMALLLIMLVIICVATALNIISYVITFRSLGSAIAITRMQEGVPAHIRRIPSWYGIFVIVMGVIGGINIISILFGINLMNFSEEINCLPYTEK